MTIVSDLERARRLIFAADEIAAKELLLSLGEQIEELDRDDLLMEVYAQLGEIYLVRTAYDGVEDVPRRIADCLAIYQSIRAAPIPSAAQVTMSDADVDHMLCRYSRRAQFLRTGLAAAAHGDHDAAEAGLLVLTDDTSTAFPDLAAEHGFLVTYARILCATALCDDDLYVRSVPLWEQRDRRDRRSVRRQRVRRLPARPRRHRVWPVLRRDRAAGRSGAVASARRGPR